MLSIKQCIHTETYENTLSIKENVEQQTEIQRGNWQVYNREQNYWNESHT